MHNETIRPTVAIVDYGMGNLFSVARACEAVDSSPIVTSDPVVIEGADIVVLPGVGAFGDAMEALHQRQLVSVLRDRAAEGRPLVGICLGMQLLMEQGEEFGLHEGLGILPGRVVRFNAPRAGDGQLLKVPQVGWNAIMRTSGSHGDPWTCTPLADLPDGTEMYFVHSYHVVPTDLADVCAVARYGTYEFVASVARKNVIGFQFHPERSGLAGLQVYHTLATLATAISTRI